MLQYSNVYTKKYSKILKEKIPNMFSFLISRTFCTLSKWVHIHDNMSEEGKQIIIFACPWHQKCKSLKLFHRCC